MAEEIVIRINVSSGEAQQQLKNTKKSTDELAAAKRRLAKLQKQEAVDLEIVNQRIKIQRDINTAAAKSELGLADAKGRTLKQMKQFRTQAGLQNAILLESGRLASDLSFGFTAVANNLSQLVSLFGSLINTTDSVGNSLKELGKSLMGTGGVLLAVQLFIAALQSKRVQDFISSLFGATEAVKKLRKALSEATDVYGAQIGKLTTLTRLLEDKRLNDVQRTQVLKEIKKDNEELNVILDENGKITEESNAKIQQKIELLKVQAQTQALVKAIEQETVELLKIQNTSVAENIDVFESIFLLVRNFGDLNNATTEGLVKGEKDRQKELSKTQIVIDKLYEELLKVVTFGEDKDKDKGERRIKRFKQQLLDLSKTILNFNRQAELINATNAQERLDIEERFAKEDADRRLDVFRERQALRLEEFKEQVKGRENANELIKDAEAEFNESMANAKIEHLELLDSIDNAFVTKRILLKDKEARQLASIERNIENARIDRLDQASGVDELYYQARLNQINTDIETTRFAAADTTRTEQERKQSLLELIRLEDLEREIINKRQLDRIEQRKRIEMEYVGFAQGISQLLGTIAGENEALSKAALIVEKGSAIADIVVNSQAAIATSLANNAAIPPFLTPGIPNPAKPASTAAMLKDISRVKVGAAIGIANILATTISSFSQPKGGGGGAGGGVEVQAPAFNVVGASPVNQLATAVSEASDKQEISFSFNDIDKGLNTVRALETDATVFG
tara:strand:+ start:4519 stop:6741 length:2223 start_codon:yes stop_codon:yes gene_type:complete